MKKLFILLGVVFCLSMSMAVMAQNTVDVDQIGALNTSTIYQAGTNQVIDIDQTTAGNNDVYVQQNSGDSSLVNVEQVTTGGDNNANIEQEDGVLVANDKSVNVYQTAETGNALDVDQSLAGNDTALTINQTATVSNNMANVTQVGIAAAGSNTVVTQMGVMNDLDIYEDLDSGGESNTYLSQTAGSDNYAYIYTDADTAGPNTLAGADGTGAVMVPGTAAVQDSLSSFNDFFWASLGGDSQLGLTQMAVDENYLWVEQYDGGNSAGVYQNAGTYNVADILQDNGLNSLVASQNAGTYNVIDVWQQDGGDTLTLTQVAGTYNDVLVDQAGIGNTATVNQDASQHNLVNINQYGGSNSLIANQNTSAGFNQLNVEQAGGMTATVDQDSATNNIATVTQL